MFDYVQHSQPVDGPFVITYLSKVMALKIKVMALE